MARIGFKVLCTPPKQKQLERLFCESLRSRSGSKRPITPFGFSLAEPVRDSDARVGIATQKPHKCWTTQVHALQHSRAVNLLQERKLRQQRFEFRTSKSPRNPPNPTGQLQSPWMPGRRLKQFFQPHPQIG